MATRERSVNPQIQVLVPLLTVPHEEAGHGKFPLAVSMMRLNIPRNDKVYGEVMVVVVRKLVGGGREGSNPRSLERQFRGGFF